MDAWKLAADAVAVIGTGILTLSVIAIVRAPDANVKIHASSLGVMAGLLPILLAPLLSGEPGMVARSLVVGGFTALTTPLATHELARLALLRRRSGHD